MMQGAEGASYESNVKNMQKIENKLLAYQRRGELDRVIVRVPGFGGTGGIAVIGLPDWGERTFNTFEFINKINPELQSVTDVRTFAIMRRGIGGGGTSSPVQFVLQGNTYNDLAKWRDIVIEKAQQNPNLSGINSDYKVTYPQLMVQIDRNRADDLGVPVGDIAKTLETMLGQRRVTSFIDRGEEYDVIVEGVKTDYQSPQDIEASASAPAGRSPVTHRERTKRDYAAVRPSCLPAQPSPRCCLTQYIPQSIRLMPVSQSFRYYWFVSWVLALG